MSVAVNRSVLACRQSLQSVLVIAVIAIKIRAELGHFPIVEHTYGEVVATFMVPAQLVDIELR